EPVRPLLRCLGHRRFRLGLLGWRYDFQWIRPGNHMYRDRIRKEDEQEGERFGQAEVAEDARPARPGPPKEDPPSRSVLRMVPGRRDAADHEHRRCGDGADRRARDGQRWVISARGRCRPALRRELVLQQPTGTERTLYQTV